MKAFAFSLISNPKSFQKTNTIATGLSKEHPMKTSYLRKTFKRLSVTKENFIQRSYKVQ